MRDSQVRQKNVDATTTYRYGTSYRDDSDEDKNKEFHHDDLQVLLCFAWGDDVVCLLQNTILLTMRLLLMDDVKSLRRFFYKIYVEKIQFAFVANGLKRQNTCLYYRDE